MTRIPKKRPVAFRVNDPEYGWVLYLDEEAADRHAEIVSVQAQGLYVRDGTPVMFDDATPAQALAPQNGDLRAAAQRVVDEYMRPNSLARSISAGTLKALRDALAALEKQS